MSIFKKSASENLIPWWCQKHQKMHQNHSLTRPPWRLCCSQSLGSLSSSLVWWLRKCAILQQFSWGHSTSWKYVKICEWKSLIILITIKITALRRGEVPSSFIWQDLPVGSRRIQRCRQSHADQSLAVEVLDGLEQTNVVLTSRRKSIFKSHCESENHTASLDVLMYKFGVTT